MKNPALRSRLYCALVLLGLVAVVPLSRLVAEAAGGGQTRVQLLSAALQARDQGDLVTARQRLEELLALSPNDEAVKKLLATLDQTPARTATAMVETRAAAVPDSVAAQKEVDQLARAAEQRQAFQPAAPASSGAANGELKTLALRGRSQYLAGDSDAAEATFRRVETLDASHAEAKYFLKRIADERAAQANLDRAKTRSQMIEEVGRAWQRPGFSGEAPPATATTAANAAMLDKLERIVVPSVNFSGMELARVVNTLSVISEEFDPSGASPKGVNIVLIDPNNANPSVSLTLRNLPLKRVLDFVTDAVGYQYEVQADAIVVRPGGERTVLDTAFFPVSRSTVLRMTGKAAEGSAAGSTASPDQKIESEGNAIKHFLELSGVGFEKTDGATLAFDGSQLIVTQSPRNLERIRNLLARYNTVRQVEIEAKFMEVQEGVLEELGVQWNVSKRGSALYNTTTGAPILDSSGNPTYSTTQVYSTGGSGNETLGGSVLRSLSGAFSSSSSTQAISITSNSTTSTYSTAAPSIPGTVALGSAAGNLATITGVIGEFDVNAIVRALSQKSGTELLSAPKVTVLSGNTANIIAAQELRYPQNYGEIQSQVGSSSSDSSSAGVSITAGTPQDFTTRNVGVELKVTPTVEEDDYSVSLDINPRVTEFEGFVEYGGPSIAIASNTTVTVPPGFYQPIFSLREVSTKVTIWDGATLVMGGLTREDVKKVNDKVPFFGSLPLVGRLFRSEGESSQKRNLLIFVTANLMSPGGSPKKQALRGVSPGTVFQNPTIVTPAGDTPRAPAADK